MENIDDNFPENNEQQTPKLFRKHRHLLLNDLKEDDEEKTIEDNLFGEDMNNEEDNFEIPAFPKKTEIFNVLFIKDENCKKNFGDITFPSDAGRSYKNLQT